MEIELSDLEAFVVLADVLHFGQAADRLHVSQPALSKRIQRLEEKVGGPLLVRRYRAVRLTEAGRLLLGRARVVLRESAATFELSRRAVRGEAGMLRIGFGIASLLGLLPDVLLRFRRAHPNVQLQLRDMSTPDQVAALADGGIDIGFVRLPLADRRLALRPVLHERLVAALGPRSPWRADEGLRSLAHEPFLIVSRSTSASFHDHVTRLCAAAGFAPRIVQEASELITVLSLVRAGLGVAIVPGSAAVMRLPGVRFKPIATASAAWNIALAWRRDESESPLVQRFVETVGKGAPERSRAGEAASERRRRGGRRGEAPRSSPLET